MSVSVLIPSWKRPDALERCLMALERQTQRADEVLVVWQGDDVTTRQRVERLQERLRSNLRLVHSPVTGVVPAENVALAAATGEVLLLIDDDAVAPEDWIEKHLRFYEDPGVGAVGGPANNYLPDGRPFPRRRNKPIGKLQWSGRLLGNMHDHPDEWGSLPPVEVDHLVGYNMSIRRSAFGRFEEALRPYWQMFELDACLQAKARGLRVLFDFSNVVSHHPSNTVFAGGRSGDVGVNVVNSAYNHFLILSKYSVPIHKRICQWVFTFGIGSMSGPGVLAVAVGVWRYGGISRELSLGYKTAVARWRAFRDARGLRAS